MASQSNDLSVTKTNLPKID